MIIVTLFVILGLLRVSPHTDRYILSTFQDRQLVEQVDVMAMFVMTNSIEMEI